MSEGQIISLAEIGRLAKGRGLAKSDLADEGVACLRYAEIYTKYGDVTRTLLSRARPDAAKKAEPLQRGDIIFAASGETAKEIGLATTYLGDEPAVVGGDTVILTDHGQDPIFLSHALNSEPVAKQKAELGKGHSVVHIHAPDLAKLRFWLPALSEQKRIAALLNTWDAAAFAAERLTTLAERKQAALLQHLFANDGATTGTLGDYFIERKKWGRAGLPVYSVTLGSGLTPREQLDRRTESALVDEAHALVEQGDLAYNMMRMWQGALGIADWPCLVSPAYVVMQPLPSVDVRFAAAWMKSPRGLDRLWAYSHGITEDRLRLYADDFLAIPVSFPPLDRQRAVGRAHETAAQAAREACALTDTLRRQKRGLMQKLLTGEWRVPATGDAFVPGGPAADRLEAAE